MTLEPESERQPSKSILERLLAIGPGAMVAAAFIGPGTVLVALKSGGKFGTSLLWAVAFSTLACILLQEMTARLGVCGQVGLGEAIRLKIKTKWMLVAVSILVISAILIGNAAYESGNIGGGGLGAALIFPSLNRPNFNPLAIVVALLALGLLATGHFKLIERFLIGLVCIMGFAFLGLSILVRPSFADIFSGLCFPSIPKDATLFVVGLIGTTVVPYNLFLHASATKEKWKTDGDQIDSAYRDARLDTTLSILFGGMITAAILIAAAGVFEGAEGPFDYAALAKQLENRFGNLAQLSLGVGLVAAGLSSSVTAPLAAAYAATEIVDPDPKIKKFFFHSVWVLIIAIGILCIFFGYKPASIIVFAQVANGLLLPVIASFLLWVVNDPKIVGKHRNHWLGNILGVFVVAVTVVLGARSIWLQLIKLWSDS